jgi:hypothetical protein
VHDGVRGEERIDRFTVIEACPNRVGGLPPGLRRLSE